MLRLLALFTLFFLLAACGYKPADRYAQNLIGETVFADVQISLSDPAAGPILIDAVNEALVTKLNRRLVDRESADAIIHIKNGRYAIYSLETDAEGFVATYRSSVSMNVTVYGRIERSFNISGTHDFPVSDASVLSDAQKTNAVREASLRALDMLIANLIFLGHDSDRK
jgi:hypothetical protein